MYKLNHVVTKLYPLDSHNHNVFIFQRKVPHHETQIHNVYCYVTNNKDHFLCEIGRKYWLK